MSEGTAEATTGDVAEGEGKGEGLLDGLGLVILTKELKVAHREWLVDGLWPKQGVGFIGGTPKVGKSWLALDFAIAITSGQAFLQRQIRGHAPVWYFQGEDDFSDIVDRVDRLLEGRRLTRGDLGGRLLISPMPVNLEDAGEKAGLVKAAKRFRPGLVIIDPLERFLREMNSDKSSEVRVLSSFIRQDLNRGCGIGVAIVHHTEKSGTSLRGSGDFAALSEVTMLLKGDPGRVQIAVEARRSPKFNLAATLKGATSGPVHWQVAGETRGDDAVQRLTDHLRRVGLDGTTQDSARAAAKVQAKTIPELLVAAGAIKGGDKRWRLPQFEPSQSRKAVDTDSIPDCAAPGEGSEEMAAAA